jgi:class 3 adenylate cyclase
MGRIVEEHGGTVEHFAGDSMLIFFNAPMEIPAPERQAVQTAIEMQAAFVVLQKDWARHGHGLGLGIGIASGYATIGAIGFLGRSQYAAIGAVTNLAARLCSIASHGEILTTARVHTEIETEVDGESAGEQSIRGFSKPIEIYRLRGLKSPETPAAAPIPAIAPASN